MDPHFRSLRLALRLNAVFSATCALAFLTLAGPLAGVLGVPHPAILLGVGAGLAGFGVHLWVTSARRDPARLRAEALRHSLADLAWVAASLPVIALGWLTPVGNVSLAAVGVVVLALGLAQLRGLRPIRVSV